MKINQNESSDAGQSEKRKFSRAEKVFHMGLFKVSPPNEFASSSPPAFGLCLAFSTPPGPAEAADRAPSPSSFLLLLISGSTTPLGRRAAPLALGPGPGPGRAASCGGSGASTACPTGRPPPSKRVPTPSRIRNMSRRRGSRARTTPWP